MDDQTQDGAEAATLEQALTRRPPLLIDVEYADRVNFAMQQHGIPLVERVSITNDGEQPVEQIAVVISVENGECEPWTGRIEHIAAAGTYRVEPDGLGLSAARLAGRTEAERTTLNVHVEAGDRSAASSLPVDLLAFDQWPGAGLYPELLASFVTPNHPQVAALLAGARESLGEQSGRDALDGYQTGSRPRAAQIAEACFNAALARGIGYINPPASFDRDGQRVRLVDRICRENFGSCLDLSLLLASLWEQAGLHPLILLLEGHALAAVWTHDAHLPEPAIDEAARVRNLIELGEIVPVESTHLTQRGASFASAVEAAKKRMASPGSGFCAVDVRSARKRGARPLPLRAESETTEIDPDLMDSGGAPAPADTTLDRVALADRAERDRVAAPVAPVQESGDERIARWQTRLLDLSLRNRLINFRQTARTIELVVPDVARLEDLLAGESRFSIFSKSDGGEPYLKDELEARHVYTAEASAETQKRLLNLYRTARSSIEETGANLLHVAIGMLKWFESESSETPRYAPLILLPVRLDRRSTGSGYRYEVSLSEEPLRPNVTLLEKLRTDFGIDTQGLEDLPEDESGLDVPLILRRFRVAIRDTARWEVEESAFLGLFSFNKFLMWRDLQENLEGLRANRMVSHLIDREQTPFDSEPFPRPDELDDEVAPGELFCTRDADSSQLAAVKAAAEERSFVLEGPPGTGKSQTITNIIADSLSRGKRVLFVAEKMAALSVVRRRLEEDGLGPFCLELHSAKASKKEVLAQLQESLGAAGKAEPPGWVELCSELGITRSQLNSYVRELHEPRTSGESLYRVLGRLTLLGDGPRTAVPDGDIAATSAEQLREWRRQVALLVERSEPLRGIHQHPLRGIGRSEWSFTLPDEARHCLTKASGAMAHLADRRDEFLDAAAAEEAGPDHLSRQALQALAVLASLLPSSPVPEENLLDAPDAAAIFADLRRFIEAGRERDAKRSDLLTRYHEEFLALDHLVHLDAANRAAGLPGPLRTIAAFFVRRKLRRYCTAGVPALEQLRGDLETARDVKLTSAKLANASDSIHLLGSRWRGGEADWSELEKLVEWCERFHDAAGVLRRAPASAAIARTLASVACDQSRLEVASDSANRFANAWREWAAAWNTAKENLFTTDTDAFGSSAEPQWLPRAAEVLARWSSAIPELNDWCAWRSARASAVQQGLTDPVERLERGEIQREQLPDAFERSFGEKWFNAVADGIDAIRGFNAASHTRTIERFRAIDRALIERAQHAITARLSERLPSGDSQVSAQSEMGILRRELEKKSRHLPTRRLIERIPNLLPRLKPCFLMSPLSVAQYLDSTVPAFDLVVFDEASQIPVWDSVGAIARGREIIVVGDSRQLPPTNFFNTVDDEDDADFANVAIDDMESILKECNASAIPAMDLRWHYRSRHESLIAFSNHHYYQNRLHTFPSPAGRSSRMGVTFRHVAGGVYDRGGSRTNIIEAREVIDEVVRLLGESETPDSIGIVTFNLPQQGLIEDLLDEKRREQPEIEKHFTNEVQEPVFVKNLENVQGDERDTIIFSVGYGPDESGRVSMNFGPLNTDGGERRLNVAITRARRRLIVFSSLRSDQVDLKRSRALGVRHFKTFLDYADRGPPAIAEMVEYRGTAEAESDFERAVQQVLVERGHAVDMQVGCAGYRIDLAVRDPQRDGSYLIGIECDGAAYHSARTARDRDRLRQSVLEGLGWRMERVWSTEWRINRDRCIEAIERAIDQAKRGLQAGTGNGSERAATGGTAAKAEVDTETETGTETQTQMSRDEVSTGQQGIRRSQGDELPPREPPLYARAPAPHPTAPVSSPAGRRGPIEYRCALPNDPRLAHLDIFDPAATGVAARALTDIVQIEAPISEDLAMRRLAEWFGAQRITDRFRARFREVCTAALRAHAINLDSGLFWAKASGPADFKSFRIPGADDATRRDLDDVPLVERINAVVHVLWEQVALPPEELERETAKLLGVQRVTSRSRQPIAEAVEAAITRGHAECRDGRICAAAS